MLRPAMVFTGKLTLSLVSLPLRRMNMLLDGHRLFLTEIDTECGIRYARLVNHTELDTLNRKTAYVGFAMIHKRLSRNRRQVGIHRWPAIHAWSWRAEKC